MLNRSNFTLLLILLCGGLVGANCPGVGDDDDSAVDDDDSAADDDDSVGDDDDSAGDDDDDVVPTPMSLDYVDVYCEGDPDLARAEAGHWEFFLALNGYAENVKLFMWDGYGTEHYQDGNQPWDLSNIDFSEEDADPQWDEWGIGGGGLDAFGDAIPGLPIEQSIGDATANDGTIMDCYDANSQPNVEVHNYMICATDYSDAGNKQCWFCGDDEGADSLIGGQGPGGADNNVGKWTDPADGTVYEVTIDITNDGSCFRTSAEL